MRGAVTAMLVLITAVMLMGMGNLGGAPEGTVPKTDENIKVLVVDRAGVSTELSQFSLDGKVFLAGRRGEGEVNVLFHNLKEVSFGAVSGEDVAADLLLKSGSRQQLRVNKGVIFYGDTGYGAFHIAAHDISRIVFH